MKVMIADDEASIRSLVERIVVEQGFECCVAVDGDDAIEVFDRERPDLVILDIMMPHSDGFHACEVMRSRGVVVPILFLSAKGDLIDKAVGFRVGGDDYIVKPFEPQELVMRIEAHLRQHRRVVGSGVDSIVCGDVSLDMKKHKVVIAGNAVDLTPKEFQLLALFASHPGEVFTKEQLIAEAWGEEYSAASTSIAVFIRRIRQKIEENPSKPKRLETVWYVGYKFTPQRID